MGTLSGMPERHGQLPSIISIGNFEVTLGHGWGNGSALSLQHPETITPSSVLDCDWGVGLGVIRISQIL